MSFWSIFGNMAISDKGETLTRITKDMSISSDGTTHTKMGNITMGSEGSTYTQLGSFSSDGSTRMGSMATGIGALFNNESKDSDSFGMSSRASERFGSDDDSKW